MQLFWPFGQLVVVIPPLKRFSSIVNLPNPICKKPWLQHTQAILKAAETLLKEELKDAATFEAKKLSRDIRDIEDCSDEEQKIVDVGANLD